MNPSMVAEILKALPKPTAIEKRKHQRKQYIKRCLNHIVANKFLKEKLPIEGLRVYACFNYWRQCNGGKV